MRGELVHRYGHTCLATMFVCPLYDAHTGSDCLILSRAARLTAFAETLLCSATQSEAPIRMIARDVLSPLGRRLDGPIEGGRVGGTTEMCAWW